MPHRFKPFKNDPELCAQCGTGMAGHLDDPNYSDIATAPHRYKDPGPADDPDLCRSCYEPLAAHTMFALDKTCANCGRHIRMHADGCTYNPNNLKEQPDNVNHPAHYTAYQGVEVIDLTEQMNFNRGNAVKYIARAGLKDKSKEIEDLQKAAWYLDREIERLKKGDINTEALYQQALRAMQSYKEEK